MQLKIHYFIKIINLIDRIIQLTNLQILEGIIGEVCINYYLNKINKKKNYNNNTIKLKNKEYKRLSNIAIK